ncbi:hypothetical protein MITS9508_01682 [Synechococcus sp. MIT S9508]|nr:hypothetical protein MITS9508_01682 [Synechococcus sp. MIT S9508]
MGFARDSALALISEPYKFFYFDWAYTETGIEACALTPGRCRNDQSGRLVCYEPLQIHSIHGFFQGHPGRRKRGSQQDH